MRSSKVVSACIFNELQAIGLLLAFDAASMRTDHFTGGKKYRKLVSNAVFIIKLLCFRSGYEYIPIGAQGAVAKQHMPRGYRIRTVEYGKILVMLVCG